MPPLKLTGPESNALAGGLVIVAVFSALAFYFVGWLGLGLIGLAGLLISNRFELFEDATIGTFERGSRAADLLTQQLGSDRNTPERRIARAAERGRRAQMLYLVNTLWIGLAATGIGEFFLTVL